MTLVHFHLTDAEGSGFSGSVSLVPTRRVTVRDAIRLPVAQTVRLDAGEAVAEVMSSTTQWVWRVSELVAGGAVRYVEVPSSATQVEYAGLVDVDPATLDQSSETVAAWETVTRAAQSALDQIESIDDKVTRAESSAQAAKASEGVAGQESAKALASQTAAASSARLAHEAETTAQGLIGEARTIASAIETARDTATAAASQAKASETAAVKSAESAKTSASTATAKAEAATKAVTTSGTSADAAGRSATAAAQSATTATTAATKAENNAATATAKATAAVSSADNAAKSATAAKTSADNAQASMTKAKTSETAAATAAETAAQYAAGMAHWIQCADMTDALAKSKQDATALCWWPREANS